MTISAQPWHHPDPGISTVRLEMIPEQALHALASGRSRQLAARYATPFLTGPDCAGLWRHRSAQVGDAPGDAPWITRLIVDTHLDAPVGVAGFHGPPDATGMVEVGYRVDPALRRRGYARRALEILLHVARIQPGVSTVRATISPDNAASRALIDGYGFVERGEQWDEEDGLEIIYELPVSDEVEPHAGGARTRTEGENA
ncbi:GNAT family N-acetyltransferase [Microbacterium sp. cf332]|uniref:GNAT family N-acetyltransferase n=1 Tax=Microbacterium sp. cf332 TaxID=1761804 RepID=UPI0008912E5B|nr:GNAT family N-acetyltransferase [Microbacterium sp. cf332]SDQ56410.1 Protein N-acetyltransferase, RimJ/RimL family [Microbacterium sp. cf332]